MNEPETRIISDTTIALAVPEQYTKVHIFYRGELLELDLPENHD